MSTMTQQGGTTNTRISSIDAVRGVAMVLMALDHVRLFFHEYMVGFTPTDLSSRWTGPVLFFTRLATHFCAPTFVFLAGVGIYLSAARGKPKSEVSSFLIKRGVWLVFLDLTIIHLSWHFKLDVRLIEGGVIWVIGWAMVLLAGLIYLPRSLLLSGAILVLVLQHTWSKWEPQGDVLSVIWSVLYSGRKFPALPPVVFEWLNRGDNPIYLKPLYGLLPWTAVLSLGYGTGPLLEWPPEQRRTALLRLTLLCLGLFLVIRLINLYGDPKPWHYHSRTIFTLMSFLNCEKYPPSLLFLLMTFAPMFLMLALFDREILGQLPDARLTRWLAWGKDLLATLGKAPLIFYLVHLPLIHLLVILAHQGTYGKPPPWTATYAESQDESEEEEWEDEESSEIMEQLGDDGAMVMAGTSVVSMLGSPLGQGGLMAVVAVGPVAPPFEPFHLSVVYVVWLLVVAVLCPLCWWFAALKRRYGGFLHYL